MHSEGLTFQPVVESDPNGLRDQSQESATDDFIRKKQANNNNMNDGNGNYIAARPENFEDNINYAGEVQKMVLESKKWFFDEEDQNVIRGDNESTAKHSFQSSSTDDGNVITKFGKRIMHTCSPKKRSKSSCFL